MDGAPRILEYKRRLNVIKHGLKWLMSQGLPRIGGRALNGVDLKTRKVLIYERKSETNSKFVVS